MGEEKLKEVFADMIVLKNPQRAGFFKDLKMPSYMRDWLVMKFSDEDGNIDPERVQNYIKRYVPSKDDFEQMKFQLTSGETINILTKIRVSVDIKTGDTMFDMPDFGNAKTGAGGVIEKQVVEKWQNTLLKESENWGIIELTWMQDYSKKKASGFIKMTDYRPFCPYTVDLEDYKEGRRSFTMKIRFIENADIVGANIYNIRYAEYCYTGPKAFDNKTWENEANWTKSVPNLIDGGTW